MCTDTSEDWRKRFQSTAARDITPGNAVTSFKFYLEGINVDKSLGTTRELHWKEDLLFKKSEIINPRNRRKAPDDFGPGENSSCHSYGPQTNLKLMGGGELGMKVKDMVGKV